MTVSNLCTVGIVDDDGDEMPDMTGLELLRRLSALGRTIPSILVTGLPDPKVAREARALGTLNSLAKPIGANKLLTLVGYAAQ